MCAQKTDTEAIVSHALTMLGPLGDIRGQIGEQCRQSAKGQIPDRAGNRPMICLRKLRTETCLPAHAVGAGPT